MKKIFFLLAFAFCFTIAGHAQTTEPEKAKVEGNGVKAKVKPRTTPKQKVHNTIHPKRKESSGEKMKGKTEQ